MTAASCCRPSKVRTLACMAIASSTILYLPEATGPLLVHRLDMSTSGILLVAKTKEAHEYLQYQFIRRTIKKRYVARLDGELKETGGVIDLPLRVDLNDRPRQLVCYEYGKHARTEWELMEVKNGCSDVYFYPVTGRTHQLRAHMAELGHPIIGDGKYGGSATENLGDGWGAGLGGEVSRKLHLHARSLTIQHPITKAMLTFTAPLPDHMARTWKTLDWKENDVPADPFEVFK